jgi:hypothetical protein
LNVRNDRNGMTTTHEWKGSFTGVKKLVEQGKRVKLKYNEL